MGRAIRIGRAGAEAMSEVQELRARAAKANLWLLFLGALAAALADLIR